jgi:L-threonylcarbamoyladenylate synthase
MRQGAISKEELQRSFPTYEVVIASKEENQQVPTPGSKYRHYAPAAKVEILPEMKQKSLLNEIKKLYKIALDEGEKVGILCSEEVKKQLPESLVVLQLGSEKELSTIAANFFSVLIECDARKLTKVYVQSFSEAGIGRTIMERMRRAADV